MVVVAAAVVASVDSEAEMVEMATVAVAGAVVTSERVDVAEAAEVVMMFVVGACVGDGVSLSLVWSADFVGWREVEAAVFSVVTDGDV